MRTSLLLRELVHLRRAEAGAGVSGAARRGVQTLRRRCAFGARVWGDAARTAGEETEESENSLSSVLKLRARFVLRSPGAA